MLPVSLSCKRCTYILNFYRFVAAARGGIPSPNVKSLSTRKTHSLSRPVSSAQERAIWRRSARKINRKAYTLMVVVASFVKRPHTLQRIALSERKVWLYLNCQQAPALTRHSRGHRYNGASGHWWGSWRRRRRLPYVQTGQRRGRQGGESGGACQTACGSQGGGTFGCSEGIWRCTTGDQEEESSFLLILSVFGTTLLLY